VAAKSNLRKVVDETTDVRCASGLGRMREEVWQDKNGVVVRYNLAFINRYLTSRDNGRVLGYDNNHGYHHRHFMGETSAIETRDYGVIYDRFIDEVRELRKE